MIGDTSLGRYGEIPLIKRAIAVAESKTVVSIFHARIRRIMSAIFPTISVIMKVVSVMLTLVNKQ